MFKPDNRKTTYFELNPPKKVPPKIIFGTTALKWIWELVDNHQYEVGFYAVVDRREYYTFFIRDVFYPKHSAANAGTCEISPEGENDMIEWMVNNGKEGDIEKVKFWGHSHHNMGTTPSGQDEKQALERMKDTQSFLVRAICTKQGEMSVSFFDFENKIRFDNIKWTFEDDSPADYDSSKIETITEILSKEDKPIKEKIEEIKDVIIKNDEKDFIKNKVLKLKEINLPKDITPAYNQGFYDGNNNIKNFYDPYANGYRQYGSGRQTSLFKNDDSGQGGSLIKTFHRNDDNEELELGFDRSLGGYDYPQDDISSDDEILNKEEMSKVINNWENEQGIIGG